MRSTKKLPSYLRIKAPAHHTHPSHTRKHLSNANDSVACQAPAKLRLACRWGKILQSKISCDQNLLLFPPTSPRDFSWCQGFARGNFANTRSCCRWRRQNCGRRACRRTTHRSSETLPYPSWWSWSYHPWLEPRHQWSLLRCPTPWTYHWLAVSHACIVAGSKWKLLPAQERW